ncbi:MAG: HAMP domain-containing protein [Chloroflexi bacterium]|nr:HAMP domain-containing protein [Chloroflexota bacterium]
MRSLATKLLLAFLAVSLIGVALASVLARWTTVQEFDRLVLERAHNNFLDEVTTYYQTHGSWSGVSEYFRQKFQSSQPLPRPGDPGNVRPPPQIQAGAPRLPPVPFILIDRSGYVVHALPPYRLGDYVPAEQLAQGTPVKIGSQVVGTMLATGSAPPMSEQEQQYLDRTNQALLVSALGAATLALLLSIVLARTLTQPMRELTGAIRAMAQGKLGIAVAVHSRDEIGELTTAFNQMSADLARANQLRRQMTADIAHDLRTPLNVIGGYIESLSDGVLEPNSARFAVMHQEVQQLQHLVEDLRTLSLADAGELKLDRQRIAPQTLLERAASAFKHQAAQKQITLHVETEPGLPEIAVDETRMAQVLGNLVSNALRYTPEGGRITLSAKRKAAQVILSVDDNGAGIDAAVLPHIFERFYRADPSRQGNAESGLGLAIAKSFVEAHGGALTATSEGIGRGSTVSFSLPAEPAANQIRGGIT